jgi:hypothetical protein
MKLNTHLHPLLITPPHSFLSCTGAAWLDLISFHIKEDEVWCGRSSSSDMLLDHSASKQCLCLRAHAGTLWSLHLTPLMACSHGWPFTTHISYTYIIQSHSTWLFFLYWLTLKVEVWYFRTCMSYLSNTFVTSQKMWIFMVMQPEDCVKDRSFLDWLRDDQLLKKGPAA